MITPVFGIYLEGMTYNVLGCILMIHIDHPGVALDLREQDILGQQRDNTERTLKSTLKPSWIL